MRSEIFYIIIAMAAVTFITRFSCIAVLNQKGLSSSLARWLKHIPTAILTALIVPALLLPQGKVDFSLQNHYLIAGIAAAAVAYKSKNIMITLAVGMGIMVALRLLN